MEFRCQHHHTYRTHPACFIKDKRYKDHPELWKPKKHWSEGMKVGFLDIETTGLQADFDHMLSWYVKPEGSKDYDYWIISPDEIFAGMEDYWGTIMFIDAVSKYDILMTWYGDRFDIPYLRTRAAIHRLKFPVYREKYHIDLWKTSRSRFKFQNNRLANVTDKLNIRSRKTPLKPAVWKAVRRGDQDAIDYIAKHNRKDVDVLEEVYKIFKPSMTYPRSSI